jgi:MYXO-CTERM domain-containing protein
LIGWGVTVKVIAEDCNKYKNYAFQCETSFSAISSDDTNTSSTMMISGAALLGVAAALAILARRRQMMESTENDEQQSGFEMMKDNSAVPA